MIQNDIMMTLATMMRQPFLIFAAQMRERTDSSLEALQLLAKETDVTAGRIAEYLDIKPSSVTQLIKKLEENELVERRKSEQDARVTFVDLTEKGREMASSRTENTTSIQQTLFGGLSEEELQQFYSVLTRLNEKLKSPEFFQVLQQNFGNDRRWQQFSKMSSHFERAREQMMKHARHYGGGAFCDRKGERSDEWNRRFFQQDLFEQWTDSRRKGKHK